MPVHHALKALTDKCLRRSTPMVYAVINNELKFVSPKIYYSCFILQPRKASRIV
jgi:hypothetical protein